jgi:uncharacterized cupin superfamily protein
MENQGPVLNLADAPTHSGGHGEHFAYRMSELSEPIGGRAIGANVTRVPAGKAAFPLHHHRANEEHFFVLSGQGVLRVGDSTYPVKANDYVVNLPGDASLAHQFVNTGDEDLVYLAISTRVLPEVVGYPDSGKTGVRVAAIHEPGARFLVRDAAQSGVGYFDGEDGHAIDEIVRKARQDGGR